MLSDIAEVCGISPNYFCKIFKEETGKSFVDFLNELRINKAKELLLSTNLKSYEVAEKVGFSDYKYFSMIFKKYTGLSPRKFKEEGQK
ncbi:helix-turn-helix domain-containing protein [Caldicellulosiruptor kronotskyensis]|uniref:helix-turn-helix domain-containing protein n=1 Tax=Caldicellulosiruptor kronotskyensis TaxID=413889 RepID=UPI0001E9A620|nr:helix-turn-helix transcriptional regulator [Caldicellulosiruptor kronotskyensis]